MAPATDDVAIALDALRRELECCSDCALHDGRTKVVFGEGDPHADLMFVGEAPGYHEDQQGRPFVGQAGKLLEQLLGSIGLTREQVYIANVLKCRPPGNRDPRPEEIAACRPYLWRQIEIIKPKVICTLGNFATKLLSGDQTGITRVHGQPRPAEIAGRKLYLYPIFHPAAALYTPAMLTTLNEDVQRVPELLTHAAPGHSEAAGAPAADRPAWRPPERLRKTPEAPAETAPDDELHFTAGDPEAFDEPNVAAGDPVAPVDEPPAAPDELIAAEERSPAGDPAGPGGEPPASRAREAPAGAAPAGGPEQLGLF